MIISSGRIRSQNKKLRIVKMASEKRMRRIFDHNPLFRNINSRKQLSRPRVPSVQQLSAIDRPLHPLCLSLYLNITSVQTADCTTFIHTRPTVRLRDSRSSFFFFKNNIRDRSDRTEIKIQSIKPLIHSAAQTHRVSGSTAFPTVSCG